ncbi:hypothetical protein GCM10007320_43580 [Pseudorhodoferax aquiterrae]|uniref:DUF4148 domain-containing protein n=1 Tax=Pseudorhodoferax aquiterrae TaxID=747304 RepID=A0ABQ3G7C0_9BURK|nr:DUF4148 domain-containing protein [Pseudorhodoferax aquiterrae]GHC92975.1 hypothetical protein GCM10007320_43580 [Pseudorhodoferax aquiterrae]
MSQRHRFAIVALAALIGAASQASAASDAPLTREQVRAEYFKARDSGRLSPTGEVGYVSQVTKSKSVVSRAEVLRDLAEDGPQSTAEGSDIGTNREALSLRSRAEVHAEAVQAVREGTMGGGKL